MSKDKSFGLTCSCGRAAQWLYMGQPACSAACVTKEVMRRLTPINREIKEVPHQSARLDREEIQQADGSEKNRLPPNRKARP
jgi:hypothetical protein